MKKNILFVVIILFVYKYSVSQDNPFKVLDEKEINFLYNYYEQDGNHSPVTGGIGTEELTCHTPSVQINIPFDTVNVLAVNAGLDYYTSASCNRIDRFVTSASSQFLSSASSSDTRSHFEIDYTRINSNKHTEKGAMLGYSNEFDVNSISADLHFSKADKYENRQLNIKGSVFYDIWKLIYPGEIRNGTDYRYGNEEEDYDLDHRITSTLSFSYSQVVNRKLQFVLSSDFVYQNGILNTPFHRVYFDDGFTIIDPDTNFYLIAKTMFPENLPRTRFKIPVSLRVNYYLTDFLIARLFYRYYYDDFEISAHTFSVELPVKITSWLMVYPLYRFYTQSAAKYFAEFGTHKLDENYQPVDEFYTSDYDLSVFTSNKFGGGIRISPVYGLKKWDIFNFDLLFKSVEFRYANYFRSDGLKSFFISTDLCFTF